MAVAARARERRSPERICLVRTAVSEGVGINRQDTEWILRNEAKVRRVEWGEKAKPVGRV